MRYTDEQKQEALRHIRKHGGSVAEASRQLDIPYSTLMKWYNAAQLPEPDLLQRLERKLGDHALTLAEDLMDKDADPPINQRASALGTLVDRLLKFEKLRDEREGGAGSTQYIVRRVIFQDADGIEYNEPSWAREGDENHGQGAGGG